MSGTGTRFVGLEEAGRWEWAGGGTLNDIFFVDAEHGWASGNGIWKTTDGGANWSHVTVLADSALSAVVFADAQRGWADGNDGVWRTEDGGETWVSGASLGRVIEIDRVGGEEVWGVTLRYSWGAGGDLVSVYRSRDGGVTWGLASGPGREIFGGGDFHLAGYGWLASTAVIDDYQSGQPTAWLRSTTNGGATWLTMGYGQYDRANPDASVIRFGDISFGSPSRGWLIGSHGNYTPLDGFVWRSSDGGLNWTEQISSTLPFSWVQAWDADKAWIGQGRTLLATGGGSATWETVTDSAPPKVRFRTTQEGWGVDGSRILKTTDGGRTWRTVFTLPGRAPEWFYDHLHGWRFPGGGVVERTADGGDAWQAADTGLPGVDGYRFVDVEHGWAWNSGSLALAHTTDGGATWASQSTGSDKVQDLQFPDAQHGWVRTSDNQLRRTTDGGATWSVAPQPPIPLPPCDDYSCHREVNQLTFVNATRGWLTIGVWGQYNPKSYFAYGLQLNTYDGGDSWGDLGRSPMRNVFFVDEDVGWGVTEASDYFGIEFWNFYRTTDGGGSWQVIQRNEWDTYHGNSEPGPGQTFAVDRERLWVPWLWYRASVPPTYSSDGGATWTTQRAESDAVGATAWLDPTGRAFGSAGATLLYRNSEIPAYRAERSPTLDGDLADWAGVPSLSLNADRAIRVQGLAPVPLDASATLQAAWDDANLYFAVRVYDDHVVVDSPDAPWLDDAVELALDGRHDHLRRWDAAPLDDHQFTVTATGAAYCDGVPDPAVRVAPRRLVDGYALEIAIPRARLGGVPLAAGQIAGFNWSLSDDDDGGDVDARLFWLGRTPHTYAPDAGWGQVRFSALNAPFIRPGETATPAPTRTPRPTATPTATATMTLTPSPTASVTRTSTPSSTPSATRTPSPTRTSTPPPSSTPTATPAGSIAGAVWHDRDGDGVREAGEPGLASVLLRLTARDVGMGETLSQADGSYRFAGLAPALYAVHEVQPIWLRLSSTPDERVVLVIADNQTTIDFGDWNGWPTWLPVIVR